MSTRLDSSPPEALAPIVVGAPPDLRNRPQGEAVTKGTGLLAARDFAEARYPSLWPAVLAKLSERTRACVQRGVLPNGWYPLEDYIELVETLARLAPDPDTEVAAKLARWEVRRDLQGGIYRALLAIASPSMAIRVSARMWSLYHKSGRFRATASGDFSATLDVRFFAGSSSLFWHYILGFCEEVAELANAIEPRATLVEGGAEGDHYMVAELVWR